MSNKKDKDKEQNIENPVHEAVSEYLNNVDVITHNSDGQLPIATPKPEFLEETNKKYSYKRPSNQKIIDAFYRWRGVKFHIAKNLGVSRNTLDNWIKNDTELKNSFEDACMVDIEHTESKLNELIDGVLVQDYDFKGKPVVYKRAPEIKAISLKLLCRKNSPYYRGKGEESKLSTFEDTIKRTVEENSKLKNE